MELLLRHAVNYLDMKKSPAVASSGVLDNEEDMLKDFDPLKTKFPYGASQQLKQTFRRASKETIKKVYAKEYLTNEKKHQVVLQAAR